MRVVPDSRTFAFRYDTFSFYLLGALACGPRRSAVDVTAEEVEVRLGWAFRTRFPRSSILSVITSQRRYLSRGAHGAAHRWLVNGSTNGLVEIGLEPRAPASVAGFPVSVALLIVSVEDPEGLIAALSG